MSDIFSTFIEHIKTKQDGLRQVMSKWTPAARGQDIDNAVRRTYTNYSGP